MAESKGQIAFEQLGIGSLLAHYSLRVPPNQREYSWEERETGALFQDLADAISDGAPQYFLGSIVAIPIREGLLEIVDGQQRLATTAILLAAIRDYLRRSKAEDLLVEDIDNRFLSTIDRDRRERVARLQLNTTDNNYFDLRVMKANETTSPNGSSQSRIDEAAKLAAKHVGRILAPHDARHYGDVLNRWVGFIEHRATVILLKVPSDVNAYKMFETLNDRGLRTSQSDLVKNYLFGQSAADRLQEAQQSWASMKAILESLDPEDITITYLRQMLISLYGYLREDKVYETVQMKARGSGQAIAFLSKMANGAADYAAILNPAHERWNPYPPTTRRAIATLIQVPTRPLRPLLLSVTRELAPVQADKVFRFLVNASVRLLIVGGARSGVIEKAIADLARDVSEHRFTTAQDVLRPLRAVIPADPEFEEHFRIATVSQAVLARYYLRSLELQVKGDPYPAFIPNEDQTVINLEHILPARPEANWPEFAPDIADAYYKRIGNMALLQAKKNSDLRSAPFSEKRQVFAESPYELTRQIAAVDTWTTDTINARQATLAAYAVKAWSLNVP